MWINDQLFTFTGRWAFCTIYCHSLGGDTAVALGGRAFYMMYAHSPQCDTVAGLDEFGSLECSCYCCEHQHYQCHTARFLFILMMHLSLLLHINLRKLHVTIIVQIVKN